MTIFTIIIFFVVILTLVMVHEFGHFIAAKLSKMRVDEFAFGFPPKLFGKKIGETVYAFNILPIGGYVKIAGESYDDETKNHDPRLFNNRPKILQIFVLLAGVFMNFLLAFLLLSYTNYGQRAITYLDADYAKYRSKISIIDNKPRMLILYVADNSPAKSAGIERNDEILWIKSGNTKIVPDTATSVIRFIYDNQNNPITINFKKHTTGEVVTSTISAVYGILPDKKSIGLAAGEVIFIKTSFLGSLKAGALDTYNYTKLTIGGLGDLVSRLVNREDISGDIAGPLGIAKLVGHASEEGVKSLLFFVAIISINLGVFNLLPLPALDGGRIIFVLYEAIFRKRMNKKFEIGANFIGFSLLIILMIVVTYFDIKK